MPDTDNAARDRTRRPFSIEEGAAILMRTPGTLDALLRGLPDGWIAATEGGDTWSPLDVVAHLVHTERTNWIPRARILLEHGESRPFDEFDRFGHLKTLSGRTVDTLLDEFAAVRQESLRALARLQPADLERRGRHPALGPVPLRQIMAAWVAHDLDHIMQISRVLARQYTDEVGPWREYLRILRD